MSSIADNLRAVRERVAAACERAGRHVDDVTIVGVTKTFGADMVDAVAAAGVMDIGENRVQEFLEKSGDVSAKVRWHLIGPLQRNKATKVIGRFALVHTIDSIRIAETLSRLGVERGVETNALLQVNTSGEDQKHGFSPAEVQAAAAAVMELPALDLRGLMTIGPVTQDDADTRRCFRDLAGMSDALRSETGLPLPELSMGMSGDFEAAVEEGATIIRLGRILTGERAPR